MSRGMPPPKRREASFAAAEFGPSSLELDGIEVTQVVQDMSHSVTLVAEKPAVVRVYLSRPAGGAITLRGEIAVRTSAAGPPRLVPSLDTVRVSPAQNGRLRLKREDLRLSLNFLLPPALTAPGSLFVSVASLTEVETGSEVDCPNCSGQSLRVRFKAAAPLRVQLVRLRYRTEGSTPHTPRARDVALFRSWLGRAFPVSRVVFDDRIVEADIRPPFDDDTCVVANAQLAAIRNLDVSGGADRRTHYYGMVADSGDFMRGCANDIPHSPDPTAVASGPSGPQGYAWDTDGSYGDWYGAHELAHTYGRLHPGFCNRNTRDDLEYPFTKGRLSDDDGAFVGFDVGDQALGLPMRVLPGARWHDVMTYCARQWMSSYTYEGVARRLAAEEALGAGAAGPSALAETGGPEVSMASGDFINVVGTVNLTKQTGSILYVNLVSGVSAPAADADGAVQVNVKTAGGEVLAQYAVPVKFNTCAGAGRDRTGLLDFLAPWDPRARALDLLVGGRVVDTFSAAPAPPDAASLRDPEAAPDAPPPAWDQPQAAPSNVTYNVQVSLDEGRTWQTVSVGRATPDVDVDRDQFPAASEVMIRVVATDGFTSTVVTSETFNAAGPEE